MSNSDRRNFCRQAAAAILAGAAGVRLARAAGIEAGPPMLSDGKTKNDGERVIEPILEPDLPIIDPHQHLWLLTESFLASQGAGAKTMRGYAHYLLEDFLADAMTGHNIRATVYMEADPMRPMYRPTGPEEMKTVGEVEFANGVAAMATSGIFGAIQVCAAIVGHVELERGEVAVRRMLEAHLKAGGGRYRGIRQATLSSKVPHLLLDRRFREGFRCLHPMGLSFDALVRSQELPELTDLVRAFPETQFILNHLGLPNQATFSRWRADLKTLAACDNVAVKLGGLGMAGAQPAGMKPPFKSSQLVPLWKPFIEGCIEAFGAGRCMFESNFPMDSATCSYPVLWNTFKRLTADASAEEKNALFHGTAARVYRIAI